jgi:hypothetical protein
MSETPIIDRAATAEQSRLQQSRDAGTPWKLWGPYLSERQWGTVREGLQRERRRLGLLFPRSGALARLSLGEDGVAGFSDDKHRISS